MTFNHRDNRKFSTAPQNEGANLQSNRITLEVPMDAYREKTQETIDHNKSSIVVGPTGSGKTTRLPVFLLEKYPNKRIAITSPRADPAREVAKYVAKLHGSDLGRDVGYVTRETKKVSQETRATFMTDGVLLAILRNDPMLLNLDVVMVDEAHERTINIDLALGLLKQAQRLRKEAGEPGLKIIVASATIEEQKFANYFEDAPVVSVPGKMYQVDVTYRECEDGDFIVGAANEVKKFLDSHRGGDILVFMPGEEEIKKTISEIKDTCDVRNIDVLPLYSSLPIEEKDKVFENQGRRRIIVSTNVAETSVTIEGVRHVIDSGYLKQNVYNPETGVNALVLTKAAQANMNQRTGRAGRTAPGSCCRLISKNEFNNLEPFQQPEILRADLGEVVLRMKDMGIQDVEGFDFIDKPSKASIHSSLESLKQLGALDDEGDITAIGKEMVHLQVRPDLSRMLIEAKHLGVLPVMVNICSMMSSSDKIFRRLYPEKATTPEERSEILEQIESQKRLFVNGSDPLTYLNVWNQWSRSGFSYEFIKEHGLSHKALKGVGDTRLQILRALGSGGVSPLGDDEVPDRLKVAQCILAGVPDSLFCSSDNGYSYKPLTLDQYLAGTRVFPGSSAFKTGSDCVLALNIRESVREKDGYEETTLYTRNCHNVTLEELKKILPEGSIVEKQSDAVYWSDRLRSYVKKHETFINGVLAITKEIKVDAPEGVRSGYDMYPSLNYSRSRNYFSQPSIERPFEANGDSVPFLFADIKEHNYDVRSKVQNYIRRAPEEIRQVIKRRLFPLDDISYYQEVIDLLKLKTKEDFIANKDAFEIKLHEYLTQDEIAKIDAESPEKIVTAGKTFKVEYDDRTGGDKKVSVIIEDIEDVSHLQGVTLPSFGGAPVVFSLKKPQVVARASRYDTGFYMRSYSNTTQDQTVKFSSLNELLSYYEQEKKAEEKRARRKERKAIEGAVADSGDDQSDFGTAQKEVTPVDIQNDQIGKKNEQKEKVASVSLEIADMRGLLSYLRGVTQEKNVRELKDKEKVLDRIKEISSKLSQSAKELEDGGGGVLNQGTAAELLQSLRALLKRIGMSPSKAEQLPYVYKHNKNALIASLERNEVPLDDELEKKIATKSADRSFESDAVFTDDEADEIIIELV